MEPKKIISIVEFIKGNSKSNLVVENKRHAKPLARVLFESKVLYDLLHSDATLDEVTKQISIKNEAAREYEAATGIKWPF